ncbi:MAG: DUF308 domain-containing protein [Bacilli bacterium]|nr:DUF308 domain-containing protein [Bacilli bacterium]
MNSLFQKHKWLQVVWGIMLFVAGAITIIFAFSNEGQDVDIALGIALAVVLFAYGLTVVFSSFLELKDKFFKYEIIVGAFVIVAGVVFSINYKVISNIIVSSISISLLTFGVVFIARAILSICMKQKVWWMPLCIALAVIFVAGGVLCIIFEEKVLNICYIVLGVILGIVGIIEIYITIRRAIEGNRTGIEQKTEAKSSKKKVSKKKKAETETKDEQDVVEVDLTTEENNDNEEPKNEIVVK